ncbi:radical SAM protein [Saprospiraceae bacterium]|nr:radical SAM protein [Saprospiraceae bacterium]
MKDLLLITPPFTQLNTPYPATAYLKGFLNTKDISAFQMDLGIEVILSIFSEKGLRDVFDYGDRGEENRSQNATRIFHLRNAYIETIDEVISFLQGDNQTLARKICNEKYLPQAGRFDQANDMEWAFGSMGIQDKAKYLATLYIEDIADFIKECVDENFGFSRYAERLGMSANSFDELHTKVIGEYTYIDNITVSILKKQIEAVSPKLICFSVPFPGNLYSAFRCAEFIKTNYPDIKIAMGGGFPNTELRSVKDVRVFDYSDFITLDDGELPIELLHSNVFFPDSENPNLGFYKRTFLRENNEVIYNNFSLRTDYKQSELGTPDYSDLLLDKYISVIEVANPMHSLWSDGRWNKLTMAHGCYWGKCTFCDISLDYIKNYEPIAASLLADRMEEMIEQTGERGFHFVDEAAPPALMRGLALEILKRGMQVSWWTNIRFEKSFTADLCRLLSASGCIAVSGGLEVASNRLLELIQKGVTVEQVAQVSRNLTESGVMVHAYLMYAYPTQTVQETIDSLEMVRQMFEQGVLQSGFWHQFAMTAHSPVGMEPEKYKVEPILEEITFANNDIQFRDSTDIDHDAFSFGLKKSLYNYMHDRCFEMPLQEWFDFDIPDTTVPYDFIASSLENDNSIYHVNPHAKLVWIKHLKISDVDSSTLHMYNNVSSTEVSLDSERALWLSEILKMMTPQNESTMTYAAFRKSYELQFEDFLLFWFEEPMEQLREAGLLVL